MTRRLFRLYQRKRVININVNALSAGLIAIAIGKAPIAHIADALGPEHKILISVIAYATDATLDLSIYVGLHWVANHWRPGRRHQPRAEARGETQPGAAAGQAHEPLPASRPNFVVDAGRVQAERIALVPIFASVSMGGMWALQHFAHLHASWAFVFAFITAMIVTRVLHTVWGRRSGTFRDEPFAAIVEAEDNAPDKAA